MTSELDPTITEGCANLLEEIDKKIMVVLRDGRTLIGVLRSVDQFANLILHQAVERIHVGSNYGDIKRGVFLVRGDNITIIGEIDKEKEEKSPLVEVTMEAILAAQRAEQEEKKRRIQAFKERGVMLPNDAGISHDDNL